MPIYVLINTIGSKISLHKLEQMFKIFIWEFLGGSKGVHLVSWSVVCQLFRDGGLGIQLPLVRKEVMIAKHIL